MTASTFGGCKCGFPKAAHTSAAITVGHSGKLEAAMANGGGAAEAAVGNGGVGSTCVDYQINMAAAAFGECKNCNLPKAAHASAAFGGRSPAGARSVAGRK